MTVTTAGPQEFCGLPLTQHGRSTGLLNGGCGFYVALQWLLDVEAIEIHDFRPGLDEVVDELFLRVVAGLRFGDITQL